MFVIPALVATDLGSELTGLEIDAVCAVCHPVTHNSALSLATDEGGYSSGVAIADDSTDYTSFEDRCEVSDDEGAVRRFVDLVAVRRGLISFRSVGGRVD